jgi:hypothetical protein
MLGEWEGVSIDGYIAGAGEALPVVDIVDDWVTGAVGQARRGPYLISVVMPTYLANRGFIPDFKSVPHDCVFLDSDGHLRVNISGLATWWQFFSRNRTDRARALQLGDVAALKTEARQFDWPSNPIRKKRYLTLDVISTRSVLVEADYDPDDLQEHLGLSESSDADT